MYVCANLSLLFKEAGSLLSRYKAAADAGFRYVECDFPKGVSPMDLAAVIKDTGVRQELINCFHGDEGEMGFSATPGCEEKFRDALETTIEYCRSTSCKKIHILSGMNIGADHRAKQIETFEGNLTWAANRLQQEDIVGLIEPINPYSKPGYFLSCYDTASAVIEKISSPYIRLQLDLFHMQMITGNISNNIKRLLPITGHIQVAQSPHRHEPSFPGELNMQYIFSELRKSGYVGAIGCEYSPSGCTTDSLSWIKEYGLSF